MVGLTHAPLRFTAEKSTPPELITGKTGDNPTVTGIAVKEKHSSILTDSVMGS